MRSRFLMELTTPEVESYLARGGCTAILPVGSTEMHGPHQPVGTDTFIAKAFAQKLAERADALILPEVNYSWAGATDGFAGTISIEPEILQQLVVAIAEKAFKTGLTRLILLSVHAPNKSVLYVPVRRLFENHLKPVLFIDFYDPFDKEAEALFAGEYEDAKEASLVLAALAILGKGDLYKESDMSYADTAPQMPESMLKLWKIGTTGYFMQDIRQARLPLRPCQSSQGYGIY